MKKLFSFIFGHFRVQKYFRTRSNPDQDLVLVPKIIHVDFGEVWRRFGQFLGTFTTIGKCKEQQQQEEEEEQQQLLPLYDLGFAAGEKNYGT